MVLNNFRDGPVILLYQISGILHEYKKTFDGKYN